MDVNTSITDAELALLEACQTEADWGATCDAIKQARGGQYPHDWWQRVMMTGMLARINKRFKR